LLFARIHCFSMIGRWSLKKESLTAGTTCCAPPNLTAKLLGAKKVKRERKREPNQQKFKYFRRRCCHQHHDFDPNRGGRSFDPEEWSADSPAAPAPSAQRGSHTGTPSVLLVHCCCCRGCCSCNELTPLLYPKRNWKESVSGG
jgi:hypothetical protein